MGRFNDQAQAALAGAVSRRRTLEMIQEAALDYAEHDLPGLLLEYWDAMERMGESTTPITVDATLVGPFGGEKQEVRADTHWIGTVGDRSWYFDRSARIFYKDENDLVSKPHLANTQRFVETVNPFDCHLDFGPSGRADPQHEGVGSGWLDEWSGKTAQDIRSALDDYYTSLLRGQFEGS